MKSAETSPSAHVLKKSQPEEFDLVILGGGTGSTVAAWTFAGEGNRVAVVDRKYIGGPCPLVTNRVTREFTAWATHQTVSLNCAMQ